MTATAPDAPADIAPAPVAIELAHPEDVGRVDGVGDPITCYHANAARDRDAGKGIPRYTGRGCDREHVEIRTPLTFPASVQALDYAGESYAAYIQRSMERSVTRGTRHGSESLGELYTGNDGD